MAWQKFNINDSIRFRMRPSGQQAADQIAKRISEMAGKDLGPFYSPDADGWCKAQLWGVMKDFGHLMSIGCDGPIETGIEIEIR